MKHGIALNYRESLFNLLINGEIFSIKKLIVIYPQFYWSDVGMPKS